MNLLEKLTNTMQETVDLDRKTEEIVIKLEGKDIQNERYNVWEFKVY